MSKIAFQPNASGTGTFTIASPGTNTNRTLTLPDEAGTVLTNASTISTTQLTGTIDATNLTGNIAAARITSALNASGSAPIYACRAWVRFSGTGTVAIQASGNVSSVTDNGVGLYTINFATAMPDGNYAVAGSASNNDNNTNESFVLGYDATATYTASALQVTTTENTSSNTIRADVPRISVAIFR
jgi:hypothetical protein